MDPDKYTGTEFNELLKQMDARQIKNSLKGAYRSVSKKVKQIAEKELDESGINVLGNKRDWKKGIRTHIYTRGGGFLLSVKARKDKSMHENRWGKLKPVLMWLNDGQKEDRATKTNSLRRYVRQRKSHGTGRTQAYHFLDNAAGPAYKMVKETMFKEIRVAVEKRAKKAGLI